MNNLKKIERLWPLFIILAVAILVLFFSIKSILSDNDDSVEISNVENNIISPTDSSVPTVYIIPANTASATAATPEPFEEFSSSAAENTPEVLSTAEVSTDSNDSNNETLAVNNTPIAETHIDNTVLEFSSELATAAPDSTDTVSASTLIIRLVNEQRNNYGLSGLYFDDTLSYAAQIRAQEIVSSFSHYRPDGSECFTAFPDGYIYMGENIASADNIVSDSDFASGCVKYWMESQSHRDNILSPNYTYTAVSVYVYNGEMYAVQLFGAK